MAYLLRPTFKYTSAVNETPPGGDDNVSRVNNGENTFPFESFLTEHKSVSVKRKFSSVSIYKVALLAGDAAAAMGAFALGLWLTGWSIFLWDDPGATAGFFILSLTRLWPFWTSSKVA